MYCDAACCACLLIGACLLCYVSLGVEQQARFPFAGPQQPPISTAGQVQQSMPPTSIPGAMTTMQQVVTQLRSPPQSAVPGMGAQAATSNPLQMSSGQIQGIRMQGIRVQGPPPQPGQQITRVRIQGSQPGQSQQIRIIGQGQQSGPGQAVTTVSGQQLHVVASGQTEMQISQQSVPSTAPQGQAGLRPRGPPGYPGNQPPRFVAPGIMSTCTL